MTHLKRTFAPDHIWFADDIFGFRVDGCRSSPPRVAAGGGAVPFTIQTRADLVSDAMARALQRRRLPGSLDRRRERQPARAGCDEQGHEGRGDLAGARALWPLKTSASVSSFSSVTWTRSWKTSWRRAQLIERARPDDIGVSVAYPLPGTKFYELVRAAAAAQDALAGEQRPGNDVPGHLHTRSSTARSATCCTIMCRSSSSRTVRTTSWSDAR